jgi:hypothetical protein
MMKVLVRFYFLFMVISGLLASCVEPIKPDESPQIVLVDALEALSLHNYEKFVDKVDFGNSGDTIQRNLFVDILKQHQERSDFVKGTVDSCIAVDVKFISDSVATVYYKLVFSNGNSELSSQKMIYVDNKWKIRIRN